MSGFIRFVNKNTYRVYASSGRKIQDFNSYEDANYFLNDFNKNEKPYLKFLRKVAKEANLINNENLKSFALYSIAELTGDINNQADLSYSSIMRSLKDEPEKRKIFMQEFKEAFDQAFINELDNPEQIALFSAMKKLNSEEKTKEAEFSEEKFYKLAQSAVDFGSPELAGKDIASIIKFIMKRVNYVKRPLYIMKLKNKIWYLNENDMASKKAPETAALGQAITFIKTILLGKKADFIRKTITEIVRNL